MVHLCIFYLWGCYGFGYSLCNFIYEAVMGLNICSLVQNGIWYFYVYFIYRAVIGLDMDWFRMVYDTSLYT